MEVSLPGLTRPDENSVPRSTRLQRSTRLPRSTRLQRSNRLPRSTRLPHSTRLPCSTRLPRPLFLHLRSYSYQARFRVQKGICLTILDEAYVSKIAVLRETN